MSDIDNFEDFKTCHCVSRDCSKCPNRNTGTGALKEIYDRYKMREDYKGVETNAYPDTQEQKEV